MIQQMSVLGGGAITSGNRRNNCLKLSSLRYIGLILREKRQIQQFYLPGLPPEVSTKDSLPIKPFFVDIYPNKHFAFVHIQGFERNLPVQ